MNAGYIKSKIFSIIKKYICYYVTQDPSRLLQKGRSKESRQREIKATFVT